MAIIGHAWADVWAAGVWGVDVWDPDPPVVVLVYRTGAAQSQAVVDLDTFVTEQFGYGGLDDWMDLEMGFAESVFIGATELGGIFTDDSVIGSERGGPEVILKTSDIVDNAIDQGTALSIRSRTFYVRGVQRDGTGMSTVILEE